MQFCWTPNKACGVFTQTYSKLWPIPRSHQQGCKLAHAGNEPRPHCAAAETVHLEPCSMQLTLNRLHLNFALCSEK